MKISDLLLMSLESLFKRKVRTILTIMGVVIGTTSIVVMLSLGFGMKAALLSSMESMGSLRAIEVYRSGRYGESTDDNKNPEDTYLTDERIEEFLRMEHVDSVDAVLETTVYIKCGGYDGTFTLRGISRSQLEEKAEKLGQGSIPAGDGQISFVYGNCIPADFRNIRTGRYDYWETGTAPDIDLMNDPVFVIFDVDRYMDYQSGAPGSSSPKKYMVETAGVIAGEVGDWNEDSYSIYCDVEDLKAILAKEFKGRAIPGQPLRKNGKPYKEIFYSTLLVNVDKMDNVTIVQQQINALGFETYANAEWLESDMEIMNIIQAVLGGIGAISLFVAAIGITNTMMMSIYERTKEIGIMKVIGCRIRDIQLLFLAEAGYIGFIGGAVGIGLSYLISFVLNRFLSTEDLFYGGESAGISQIPIWLAVMSIVFAALIAMLAGFLPSIRAMKLSPLAAIRAE
ncbi:MAG: ABC transporter permease [Lachnospiraceae bacterium]|nr:ABC transporter permease [Lachnospiraceae bacterium]